MQTKNETGGELFYEVDGERKPLGDIQELSLELNGNVQEKLSQCFTSGQILFEMAQDSRVEFEKIIKPYKDFIKYLKKLN